MNIVLNAEYDKKVHEEWVNLINHRPVALGVVRPEILETWQLCMQNGLDTDVLNTGDLLCSQLPDLRSC